MNPIEARMYLDGRRRPPPTLQELAEEQAYRASLKQRMAAQRNLELDHGYRQQTPGYREYADQALHDLFPTGADMLSTTGIPLVADAADAALAANSLTRGEYRNAAVYGLGAAIPFVGGAGILKAVEEPAKWIQAYRAHRVFERGKKRGHLYPAMIGKDTPMETALSQQTPLGVTLQSELIPFTMAERQGYHSGALPYGEQFNVARLGDPNPWAKSSKIYQPDDLVYTEASLGIDNDFSNVLSENPRIYGVNDPLPFDQTRLPEGGFYMYKNPSTPYPWYVSDYVRHDRILTDEEIADIFRQQGLRPPPPRRSGKPVDEARLQELGLISGVSREAYR